LHVSLKNKLGITFQLWVEPIPFLRQVVYDSAQYRFDRSCECNHIFDGSRLRDAASYFISYWCIHKSEGYRRLDVIRVLGLFTAFEVAYLYFWRLGNWYAHPAVAGDAINTAPGIFLLLLISGLPAALVMKSASRYAYFQIPSRPSFTWKRALLLVPLLFGMAIVEIQRTFSHSRF
jgi:hypothetical protein